MIARRTDAGLQTPQVGDVLPIAGEGRVRHDQVIRASGAGRELGQRELTGAAGLGVRV
jgi:hypothetical protein